MGDLSPGAFVARQMRRLSILACRIMINELTSSDGQVTRIVQGAWLPSCSGLVRYWLFYQLNEHKRKQEC